MTRKAFAEYVARARETLGITQSDLGDQVGVEAQQVSRWETGRSLPASRKLRLLADALKLTDAERARLHELHSVASEEDKAAAVRGQSRILGELKKMAQMLNQLAEDVAELKRAVLDTDSA